MAETLDPGARAAAEQKARKAARDAARKNEASEEPVGKKEIVPPWERGAEGIALVDTHAHIDGEDFEADREETLSRAKRAGVVAVVTFGDTMEASARVVKLAASYEPVFAGVGVHPENAFPFTREDDDRLAAWTKEKDVVAIGEIGLDYYWDDTHKAEQKELFAAQLVLAEELDLPVIVHDREAHADCLEITGRFPNARGVFHCYSGSAETASELLRLGWYLGFDGPVTYKNARKLPEVLSACPPERILLETDSPYLSPVPMRGKRNDPRNLKYICEKTAEWKGMDPEELAALTLQNGKTLFHIP